MKVDILIYAEDPGAANYLAGIAKELLRAKIYFKVFANGLARPYFERIKISSNELPPSACIETLYSDLKPQLVLVGTSENPSTIGLKFIDIARKTNIKTIGAVDASMSVDFRFRGKSNSPLAHAPDYLFVPDEWTKNEYAKIGFPKHNINIYEHPNFDFLRNLLREFENSNRDEIRKKYFPGLKKNQAVYVFASEPSSAPEPMINEKSQFTLRGRGISFKRTEVALEEFLDCVKVQERRPYLVLRLHPKDKLEDYDKYIQEFDHISQEGTPFEMIYGSDLVIGLTTTLLNEAAILHRPTLSILPRAVEKDWLHSIRMGTTPYVSEKKDLIDFFAKFSVSINYKNQVELENLSRTPQKIVDFLKNLMQSR